MRLAEYVCRYIGSLRPEALSEEVITRLRIRGPPWGSLLFFFVSFSWQGDFRSVGDSRSNNSERAWKRRKIRRRKERSISGCSAFLFVWSTYTTWLEYEKTAKGAVVREKKRRKKLESRVLACSSSSPFFPTSSSLFFLLALPR